MAGPDLGLQFDFQASPHGAFIAVVFSYNHGLIRLLFPGLSLAGSGDAYALQALRWPLAPDLPSHKQQPCSCCFLVVTCCTNTIFASRCGMTELFHALLELSWEPALLS